MQQKLDETRHAAFSETQKLKDHFDGKTDSLQHQIMVNEEKSKNGNKGVLAKLEQENFALKEKMLKDAEQRERSDAYRKEVEEGQKNEMLILFDRYLGKTLLKDIHFCSSFILDLSSISVLP